MKSFRISRKWSILLLFSVGLDLRFQTHVCIFRHFFFPQRVNSNITWIYCVGDKKYCSRTIHGSHGTIHTFKNYFAIMFSVFSFSKNKLYPNGLLVLMCSQLQGGFKFSLILNFVDVWQLFGKKKKNIFKAIKLLRWKKIYERPSCKLGVVNV